MPKLTVGLYKTYDSPDIFRQSPSNKGIWNDVQFELITEASGSCDILVVLNCIDKLIEVECGEVWLIVQEPPIDSLPWIFEGHEQFDRIYSPYCPDPSDSRYRLSHGALPWHVDLNFDELKALMPPEKNKRLSWITSNKEIFPGHQERMNFLNGMKKAGMEFDLYGYGFNPLKDKYAGLGPYQYSLAVENYSTRHYWTEKLSDCFLSWTMPIYYGCTNLADYFPEESFIQIDIHSPDVFQFIKEITGSDLSLKQKDAITEARQLVLDKYQLFPFISEKVNKSSFIVKRRELSGYEESLKSKFINKIRRLYNG